MTVQVLSICALLAGTTLHATFVGAMVTLISADDRVRIEIGGELFTEFIFGDPVAVGVPDRYREYTMER